MNTNKIINSISSCIVSLFIIALFLSITSCGSSSGGSDGGGNTANDTAGDSASDTGNGNESQQTNITATAALGNNFKNVSLTAGHPKEVKFTYTLPPSITSYKNFSVNLADTMQYVTISSSPVVKKFSIYDTLKMFAGITEAMAASTAQITAFISYPGDPAVCSSSVRFGPYNMTGDIGTKPSSETSSATASTASINITNAGSFEICVVIVPPIDAYLTVSNVSVDLMPCDLPPADILGTWTGTYSCSNFGIGDDVNDTVTLTISQNSDGSYHYEDTGNGVYNGHLCGNVFKFNGGIAGSYTESGTFVLNSATTASKTSIWNSIPPGTMGGNCTDDLHR